MIISTGNIELSKRWLWILFGKGKKVNTQNVIEGIFVSNNLNSFWWSKMGKQQYNY